MPTPCWRALWLTAMEYGVIAAGIVLAVAMAAATLGSDVSALFGSIAGSL